jgi:cytochrome c-type biogenesis protein CcsB
MNILTIESNIGNFSFASLFLTMLFYWVGSLFVSKSTLSSVGNFGMITSNFLLGSLLLLRWIISNHFPLSNLYESLMFLSWTLTLLHIVLENSTNTSFLGFITCPGALFVNAFATLSLPAEMQKTGPLIPALKSNWLMMHVSIMMLSYAALLCGSLLSIAFLIITTNQDIDLEGNSLGLAENKNDNIESFNSTNLAYEVQKSTVSSLDLPRQLDNLSYRVLGIGFPFLTLGIISGAVWANEAWGSYWSWDPKETWALITWLTFSIYFHMRITQGLQGRKPALVASFGFIIIWVCYLGVNLLGKGLHSYGWWIQ